MFQWDTDPFAYATSSRRSPSFVGCVENLRQVTGKALGIVGMLEDLLQTITRGAEHTQSSITATSNQLLTVRCVRLSRTPQCVPAPSLLRARAICCEVGTTWRVRIRRAASALPGRDCGIAAAVLRARASSVASEMERRRGPFGLALSGRTAFGGSNTTSRSIGGISFDGSELASTSPMTDPATAVGEWSSCAAEG